ncbi:MAG: AAA family ATPase [Acidobacteria bacterium]|nr:AAA family ATPase [Acidobacteriota bacterium]
MATPGPLKTAGPFREVLPEQLRWRCEPSQFEFETTADLKPLEGIIGQERALKSLKIGVELYGPGFNIFVCGLSGTGRATTIKQLLERIRPQCEPAPDRCYVHDFHRPEQPRLLTLPRARANPFRKDMDRAIDFLATRIPQLFEDEKFQAARGRILERYGAREKEMLEDFSEKLKKDHFALAELGGAGTTVVPVVAGQPVPLEKLDELVAGGQVDPAQARQLSERQEQLQKQFVVLYRKTLALQRAMNLELELLERETASVLVDSVIEDLKEKYPHQGVAEHLEAVRSSLLENLSLFKGKAEGEEAEAARLLLRSQAPAKEDPFWTYRVNVVLGHESEDGCPVILETLPTYVNLFGTIERTYTVRGVAQSDFTDIRAGSLLQADGGYLVINAMDALTEPGVWKALKRTLIYGKLEIQSAADWLFHVAGTALKPEPIPVNIKIILIGETYLYDLLYAYEDDFKKIFKVKADFDSQMNRTPEAVREYAALLRKLCDEDKLCPFDKEAVAAVVEYGVRRGGRQDKLSTRFSEIADLAREACYWARQEGSRTTRRGHVDRAIAERIERHNLIESKIQEMIEKGVVLIDTSGARVGQVNGLSVYDLGSYAFGKPVRITASTAMGRQGIINIEREANLSGRLHDKGVAILSGYLRQKFAQSKPLSLAASVCFEQSYSGVDGDSASSTEIYALLSSLADLPIRQEIAVTGSVNQKGDIQAIGGVNYKIEGFYDVCKAKGLTNTQGVILPIENVPDLMLRPEVVEAVKAGRFHLYPVATVDEGIEILTAVKAGDRQPDGSFEEGTVYARVDARLRELAEGLKDYEARPY